jgi:hypothetical protein
VWSEYSCILTGCTNGVRISGKFASPFLMPELFTGRALLPRRQTVAVSKPVPVRVEGARTLCQFLAAVNMSVLALWVVTACDCK